MAKTLEKHPNLKAWGTFASATEADKFRLIWRSWGLQKTGKNHFGLTGPGPVAGLYFDPGGVEGVAQQFMRAPLGPKEVMIKSYRFSKGKMKQADAIEVRDEFEEDFQIALKQARTIQIDESELWEVYRWAEFDDDSSAPKDYKRLNNVYRSMIADALEHDVNLQLIQKVKEKWSTIEKVNREGRVVASPYGTGVMEPYGMREVGFLVQANLRHGWDKERGFYVDVVDCRQNMALAGDSFTNLDMPTLGMLVFPESDESVWL